MAYRLSTLAELAKLRSGGQRPEGSIVVVGGAYARSWANQNRFFFVNREDIGEDLTPFTDLFVILKTNDWELAQKLALTARMVTIATEKHYENLVA